MKIRALEPGDKRSGFSSGDLELDRFFHQFAGQNQFKHYLGVTYIAVKEIEILGYATVSPALIDADRVTAAVTKQLPAYPLPVLRLARLAVDHNCQSQGVGLALTRFVLELAVKMSEEYGSIGVLVDSKPQAVGFYKKLGFVPLEAVQGASDARPQPIPMFLSVKEIKSAISK